MEDKIERILEILESGISLETSIYLILAILVMLAAGFGSYFSGRLKKSGELDALDEKFGDLKNKLAENTEIVESIKAKMGKEAVEHQVEYSKLHEKRIEVIEGLYHRICKIEKTGKDLLHLAQPFDDIPDEFWIASKAITEFADYSSMYKFWLPKDLFDEIEGLALNLDKIVHGSIFRVSIKPTDSRFASAINEAQEAVRQISVDIPDAKEKIIESIRRVIDPNEKI